MTIRISPLLAALAAAFTLCACGGGGGASDEQPAASQQQTQPQPQPIMTKTYRIEMYGDSTTYGVGATNPTTESEPAVLAALFAGRYDQTVKQVLINNQGVPGTIAQQLLAGSDGVHLPFAQLMANSNANMVILNYGMNDSVPAANEPVEYYGQVLGQLIDIARSAGKFVVLQQPNPSCTPEHAALGDYVRKLNAVAQAKGVAVVDQYLRSLELTQTINPTCWDWHTYLPDGIHPSTSLYSFKASNTFNVILPTVDAF